MRGDDATPLPPLSKGGLGSEEDAESRNSIFPHKIYYIRVLQSAKNMIIVGELKKMNKLFRGLWFFSAGLMLIMGIFCIYNPPIAFYTLLGAVSWVILFNGIISVVKYIIDRKKESSFWILVDGIVSILFGAIVLFEDIYAVTPLMIMKSFCIWVIVKGLIEIMIAIKEYKEKEKRPYAALIIGFLNLVLGILFLTTAFEKMYAVTVVIGIYLLTSGITSASLWFTVRKRIKEEDESLMLMYCKSCGFEFTEPSNTCPSCGRSNIFEKSANYYKTWMDENNKPIGTVMFIILFIAVHIAISLITYFIIPWHSVYFIFPTDSSENLYLLPFYLIAGFLVGYIFNINIFNKQKIPYLKMLGFFIVIAFGLLFIPFIIMSSTALLDSVKYKGTAVLYIFETIAAFALGTVLWGFVVRTIKYVEKK